MWILGEEQWGGILKKCRRAQGRKSSVVFHCSKDHSFLTFLYFAFLLVFSVDLTGLVMLVEKPHNIHNAHLTLTTVES